LIVLFLPDCQSRQKGDAAMRNRWLVFLVVSALVLSTLGAAQGSSGTIRGYVFRDTNQNGVFDSGEEGISWVYVTISNGEYQHTYYTGDGDPNGNIPGPGSYGPTPLQPGSWTVTVHVPDGYVATTSTELVAVVPDGRSATGVDFGIYGTGPISYAAGTGVGMGGAAGTTGAPGAKTLPATGGVSHPAVGHSLALIVALLGLLVLVGTPWCVAQIKKA
jgi:hypothetical protein